MSSNANKLVDVPGDSILNSWKEIANYLGRGVRTVQRYEQDCALPVRRLPGKSRSSVLALRHELDQWVRKTPVPISGDDDSVAANARLIADLRERSGQLLVESADLRSKNRALLASYHAAMVEVATTVRSIRASLPTNPAPLEVADSKPGSSETGLS